MRSSDRVDSGPWVREKVVPEKESQKAECLGEAERHFSRGSLNPTVGCVEKKVTGAMSAQTGDKMLALRRPQPQ